MSCKCKHFLLSILIAYFAHAVFGYLYHGIFMMPYYNATPELWRDEVSMVQKLPFMYAGNVMLVIFAALIFRKGREGKAWFKEGLNFGLLLGGVFAAIWLAAHSWMIVSVEVTALWVAGSFINGVAIGLALAVADRNPQED